MADPAPDLEYPAFDGKPRACVLPDSRRSLLGGRRHADGGWILPDSWRLRLLRRMVSVERTPDDIAVRREVRRDGARPLGALDTLDLDALARVVAEDGLDRATAWLDACIRDSEPHASFIREVESIDVLDTTPPRLRGRLLVVPASIYEELPEFGGDGGVARNVAGDLGMETGLISTPGLGRVTDGATLVRRAIDQAEADGVQLVLASISKGSSDVRLALEQIGERPPCLAAWINVCGLIRGSLLFDELTTPRGWRGRLTLKQFSLLGMPWRSFRDLAKGEGSPLHAPLAIPDGIPTISVIGLPLEGQPMRSLRGRHRRLARVGGPNDGSVLALDAIAPGSLVYPAWGVDHYFRAPSVPRTMYQLLGWMGQAGWLPTEAPATSTEPMAGSPT